MEEVKICPETLNFLPACTDHCRQEPCLYFRGARFQVARLEDKVVFAN